MTESQDIADTQAASVTETGTAISPRVFLLLSLFCAILTLPMAWNARLSVYAVDLSYLDLARHLGGWGPANLFWNGYWSPAYPAILALALKLAHPSPAGEIATAQAVNWLICLAMDLCFGYFLFTLLRWVRHEFPGVVDSASKTGPILLFAYTMLFVSNLDSSLWHLRPDLLLEGVVYLAAGICIRLSLPLSRTIHQVALGLLLALAYAAKAALFPLALLLLLFLFVRPVAISGGRKGVAVAAISFLIGVSPLVAILSVTKGRPTFSDAGKINYAMLVNEIPFSILWEGQPPASRIILHPTKIVSAKPRILKFEGPFDVTVPYLYDQSYWYDGIKTHFDLRQELRVILGSLGLNPRGQHDGINIGQLMQPWIPLFAGLVALIMMGLRPRGFFNAIGRHSWLLYWPVCAGVIYALVVLQYRYLVTFIVLGWTALFLAAYIALRPERARGVILTVAAGIFLASCPVWMVPLGSTILDVVHRRTPRSATIDNMVIAEKLRKLGIEREDQLAALNFPTESYAAWLAGARFTHLVVGTPDGLSRLPAEDAARVISALRASGAKAIFAWGGPGFANDSGWTALTEHTYIRLLR